MNAHPKIYLFALVCFASSSLCSAEKAPLFDSHIHYNNTDTSIYSPEQIIDIFDKNKIEVALVTSRPPQLAETLFNVAPDRIIPFLGVYRNHEDKTNWITDHELPASVEKELKRGFWKGIGELHLFAEQRHSPVFAKLIKLASHYEVIIQLHTDPVVIDKLYELSPTQTVIWVHAGTFPYPDLIENYLQRYPDLYIDLSVRDEMIAPNGIINADWYELFVRYPDRFLVGVDTFSISRWSHYSAIVETIHGWLAQLPEVVRQQIARHNSRNLFTNIQRDNANI